MISIAPVSAGDRAVVQSLLDVEVFAERREVLQTVAAQLSDDNVD